MATIYFQDGFRLPPSAFRLHHSSFIIPAPHRPPHIHVENADGQAKFNLEPVVEIIKMKGMKLKDVNAAFVIACQHRENFIKAFNKIHPAS